ncbi:MAG TPA: patatin-like phospholipase family protein [Dongiaceae bacterium]|nr:patatin-like phospholipase family protein [Dongiaceae bacterium]
MNLRVGTSFGHRWSGHRLVTLALACVLALATAGCANLLRQPAPPGSAPQAVMSGFTGIRYLPLTDPVPFRDVLIAAFHNETAENYETQLDGTRVYSYLSVSGGGSDGAFGAGLLNGWSKAGGRPKFKIVTGVSTGALIAPFAFLGSAYDEPLKESYTTIDARRIFLRHSLLALIWSEAATDSAPLQELVSSYIDDKLLDAIAVEHAKGRRIYVATTNLDAEQPVIWDMGAIASSKNPARLKLFRQILVASASIPAVFPPVLLDVTVDGHRYDEMHVDGGVFFQSFSIGAAADLPGAIAAAHPDFTGKVVQRLYVIRNGWVSPDPDQVNRSLMAISLRAIGTMLKVSGINDLYRLYLSCLHDNVEFNYVSIPPDYKPLTKEQFDKAEMNQEFTYGEQLALKGISWRHLPPGYSPK